MTWQSFRNPDADIAPCGRCEKDVVLDHDPPCPHGYVACPECGPEAVCRDCRHIAELDEWANHIGPPHDIDPEPTRRADLYCPIHRRRGCPCGYGDRQ